MNEMFTETGFPSGSPAYCGFSSAHEAQEQKNKKR